jgi:arylsulfatase A-like enzyme
VRLLYCAYQHVSLRKLQKAMFCRERENAAMNHDQDQRDARAIPLTNRRNFLKKTAAAAIATSAASITPGSADAEMQPNPSSARKPNVIIYIADQFRADFIGANGLNTTTRTPNLNAVAQRGTSFTGAITNQPVCSPSRSVLLTGRYATETHVWRNAHPINPELPTLASEFRKAGYTANMIGKWHLAPKDPAKGGGDGFVRPEFRGGFLDLWEGANEFEWTTHPYEGTIWNGAGQEIKFDHESRIEFITDRAERFLKQKHDKPFFLYVSQLEPHQQNDAKRMIAPKGYADRFSNPFVPADLRSFPGNWQSQLPDYYGCVEAIDHSVGRILKTLDEENLTENTIFVFLSDHGCHFMTRNAEYKRSPHNASIRVPLIAQGPGFDTGQEIPDIIGNIHVMPTLLDAAGIKVPASVKGKTVMPLLSDPQARKEWENVELIQISESMTARAIRTKDWCYCVVDRDPKSMTKPSSTHYDEYLFYDEAGDPYELVNLAGRQEYRAQANVLKDQLKQLIVSAGEPEPEIATTAIYP